MSSTAYSAAPRLGRALAREYEDGVTAVPKGIPTSYLAVDGSTVLIASQRRVNVGGSRLYPRPVAESTMSASTSTSVAPFEAVSSPMSYPRSLVSVFLVSLVFLAGAALFGILSLVVASKTCVNIALLLLASGGLLAYGCVTRAEEIQGHRNQL